MARVGKDEGITSYYLILGLRKGASEQEIKNRYRELAKIYHPDVNHSRDAEEKFKQINEAYNYLISHVGDESYNYETSRTNKKDTNITDEIIKNISRSARKGVHKFMQKNLQRFVRQKNRVIYKTTVKIIKKELRRRF